MPCLSAHMQRAFRSFLVCLFCFTPLTSRAQQQRPSETAPPPSQEEDVLRINTELVQTDVMVFDKQGNFVEGLKPEQFELRIDGKPQSISFFELIRAGSLDEDAQLAAARGEQRRTASSGGAATVRPLDRRRTFIFFVDDLHLAAGSVVQARDTMLRFVNDGMGQNDEAAIASASGQVGFLQQLTANKGVLRAAVNRIQFRQSALRDGERPLMSEFNALAIERRDNDVTGYFVDEWLRDHAMPGSREAMRASAESAVRSRASSILQQAAHITDQTLTSLRNLVRSVAPLPGRKVLFFISDGFFLNERSSNVLESLRRVTDAAARTGTVIYTMDARGLSTGQPDAELDMPSDPSGRLARNNQGELSASQEGLVTLAADTGGRALLNSNKLDIAVTQALKETGIYYLLAWTPRVEEQRGGKFRRIEVKVPSRPELVVRVRRGFFDKEGERASDARKQAASVPASARSKTPVQELIAALKTAYPLGAFPTSLSIGYMDTKDAGAVLTTSVQIEAESMDFGAEGNRQTARAEVAGVVYDAQGKPITTFHQELNIPPTPSDFKDRRRITYNHQQRLPPGLYQVRVAAREGKSGRTGSAFEWIEIPDIAKGRFSIGSIFLGEMTDKQGAAEGVPPPNALMVNVDRRFARTSKLRFLLSLYNATRGGAAAPDVALQVQIFRDDQPVITTPLRKVETAGLLDFARIPYGADINLSGLPAGQYILQVTAIDRAAKASASQRVNFMIE